MREMFKRLGLKVIIENDKETVFVDKSIIVKYMQPAKETDYRHVIQLEYNKVFLGWDLAWYKRYYTDEELINNYKRLEKELEIIQANCSKAIYVDHLMKVDGFEDWWKTDVDFIETLLNERVRD